MDVSHSEGLRLVVSVLGSRVWVIWRGAEMVGRVVFLRRSEMPLLSDMPIRIYLQDEVGDTIRDRGVGSYTKSDEDWACEVRAPQKFINLSLPRLNSIYPPNNHNHLP